MRLIFLSPVWTILLDFAAWGVLQPGAAALSMLIPLKSFDPERFPFRCASWERDGETYQTIFNIRAWKKILPSGGTWFNKKGFSLDHIRALDPAYLDRWVKETCRAEVCHWLAIVPAALFFFWNPPLAGWIMILYALAFNLPLIIAQRYNRPKMRRMIKRLLERDH